MAETDTKTENIRGSSESPESPESPEPKDANSSLVLPDQVLPPNLFVLPINSTVIYPTLMAPLIVVRPRFIETVEEAINRQRFIGLILTRDGEVKNTTRSENLYDVGVVVKVLKRLKMPDGSVNLLLHGVKRFRAKKVLSDRPHIVVEAEYLDDIAEKSLELDALTRTVISHVKRLSEVNPFFTDEMKFAMLNAPGPATVADLVAFALTLSREDAQDYLQTIPVKERFEKLLLHLRREQDVAELQKKIQEDVNGKINSMQRDFFLKEQLKVIKKELGMEEDGKDKSSRTFRERIDAAKMPEAVKKIALEELAKFETLSEQSPEYNVSRTYLETICALPWGVYTEDQLDLDRAEKILDEDHYGLEKVKARIVEFLAVRNLRQEAEAARQVNTAKEKPAKLAAKSARPLTGNGVSPPSETAPPAPAAEIAEATKKKGSIICLVGPPGVGKTSMGKSIARTLGRQFYRFSLGGMRDEAEIKGHRRTYIGAMPGKIVNAMKRAGSKNPVIMLDEIDKLGASFQGDPASALLEVLDPEQNASFLDHYLDIPFDLSDVLFIATANTTASIPAPLLDRMEVIEIAGYTLEEKELIANRYVIPKILQETGIPENLLKLHTAALTIMMKDYAREPGLRSLQMLVEKIARKAAADIVREKKRAARIKSKPKAISITPENLRNWIGPPRFFNELAERIISPGVVVGLAWTAAGGDILFIEATDLIGTGGFKLTGKMGEVMTESANIAWTYVKKKYAQEQAVKPEFFKERDVHVHIPAGAIPKDGPSAGISMATALYSLLTGRMSRQKLAMTGELSLTGKVLPVGGIKEKLLAAKRAGITEVILPRLNRKDLEEVPKYALEGMRIHFVDHVESVFKLALDEKKPRGLKKADAAKKVLRKGMRVRPASGRPTRSGARA